MGGCSYGEGRGGKIKVVMGIAKQQIYLDSCKEAMGYIVDGANIVG